MPEDLWAAAAGFAQAHGVNPVARALRLDYYSLKKRVEAAAAPPRPQFVEVSLPHPPRESGAVVEIDRPDGARLKIQLTGSAELVKELALAFLGAS